MTVTPYFIGVLCCLAAEAILMIIVGCFGYLIGKINEGKVAQIALDNAYAMLKNGDEDERDSK